MSVVCLYCGAILFKKCDQCFFFVFFFTTVTLNTIVTLRKLNIPMLSTAMMFDWPVGKYLCQFDMNKPVMALILVSVIQANIMVKAFPLF